MPGLDEAASAFEQDMGGGRAPTRDSSERPDTMSLDEVFAGRTGSHQHEDDVPAGGDDAPTEEEIAYSRKARRTKPAAAEEDPEVDPLYDEPAKDGDKPEAEDEDDEPEEDDEDDEPEEDDEDKEAEVDIDPDTKVTVVVDGKEQEVTIQEALEGYTRTETFHQRLNEIDEAKGVIRSEGTKLLNDRREAINLLGELEADLEALLPAEPDWDRAFAENPEKARALQKSFNEYKAKLEGVRANRQKQQEQLSHDEEQQIVDFAVSERGKFEGLKENQHWYSDPKRKEKDLSAMARTAKSVGFTDDEIRGTLDARMLTILLRASKYDRIVAAKPKLVQRGKQPTRPGAGDGGATRRTAQRGIGRAQQQLARTGRTEDAAAVFEQIITPTRRR